MRTISPGWLAANPVGDTKAHYQLDIGNNQLPANPDGTTARISFVFEADNWQQALALGHQLLGDRLGQELGNTLLINFMEAAGATDLDHGKRLIHEHMAGTPGAWDEYVYELKLTDHSGSTSPATLTISAPGEVHAAKALTALRRQYADGEINLSAVALEVSDQDEDPEFEDGREVIALSRT